MVAVGTKEQLSTLFLVLNILISFCSNIVEVPLQIYQQLDLLHRLAEVSITVLLLLAQV